MKKTTYLFFEFTLFCILIFLCVLLALSKEYSVAVTNGIMLWAGCVLPALFPYLFITAVLSSLSITSKIGKLLSPVTTRLFNVGGAVGYSLLASLISGYPVGAKTVSDLRKNNLISQEEAVRASVVCSTSSPVFIFGSVATVMFGSLSFGVKLFICHVLSTLITGCIFGLYKRWVKPTKTQAFNPVKVDNVFYESVFSSVISVLTVGGIITLFYLFTEILLSLGVLSPFIWIIEKIFANKSVAEGLCVGFFECTKGLKLLATTGIDFFTLPIATFICSFGGLSVIMQSIAFLKNAKIKTAPFVLSKLISAVIGFLLGFIVTLLPF